MITLTISLYVFISLGIAIKAFKEEYSNDGYEFVKNPRRQNLGASILYGFIFLPKWVTKVSVFILVFFGIASVFIMVVIWTVTNLP